MEKGFGGNLKKTLSPNGNRKAPLSATDPKKRDCGGSLAFGFGYGGRRVRHKNRQYKLFLINKFELGN